KSTTGITQPHHYFRSLKSGQWEYATTWQSSADSIQWADASLAPGATAAGITIQTPHAICINDLAYGRLVKIEKGATLNLTNDVTFILTNALENPDMIICGAFILNGNRPSNTTNATYTVEEGGIVKVVNNSGLQQSDDFIHTNPLIKFKTGSVFEWSAPTPFESANKTYFNTSSDEHPIFRISRTLFMGSAAPNHTVINGFVEVANGNTLYIQNSGTRYFRDGFGGAGNIQMTGGCIEITGTNRIYTRIYGSGSVLMSSTTSGITVSNQAKVSLSSDYIINGSGFNFSVNQGGSLHCGINTLYGSANFILASGAELGIGSADGISNGSTGNIQTAGRSFDARGIYQYNGSANQITGDALPENIQGGIVLKNNGTSGNNQITITKNLLISGFMEFNQGIFITNNTDKILCFNTNSYTAGANFHSYVAGPVKKIGNTPFIFPLGKPPVAFTIPGDPPANGFAGGYRPLEISNLSGIDTFQTEFIVSNPTIWKIKKEASDKGLQQISTCEYWNLNRSGNTRADVTLSWSVNSMGQSQCNIINPANPSYLQVVPFYNGEWGDRHDTYFGNSAIKTEAVTGLTYISWNGDRPANDINSYEKFVIGSVNTAESPLPLSIQNFDIEYIRKKVRIGWHDHHPEEIKTYILEKSKDGKIFDQLKIIQPRYNNYRKAYEEYDMHPHEGWNYYRLSIIDRENHLEHSSIKKIRVFSKENAAPISYTSGHHYIHLNNHILGQIHMITIANMAGQVLYKQYKVSKNIQINVGSLPHGLYLLSIYSSQRIINQLFTKE
ncbi:MAG: T9SS type A sorting domain-containing protein, partial [Bacteroidota bacterium]